MHISYLDLLSPEPFYLPNIGGVKSPTLREISQISYPTYQKYLTVFLMTPQSFLDTIEISQFYEALSEEEYNSLHVFDLITQSSELTFLIEKALNFFMDATIVYHKELKAFLLYTDQTDEAGNPLPTGILHKDSWNQLCQVILQRNAIQSKKADPSKTKSKKALEIMKKLQKGRENKKKTSQDNKKMELGNIISAVAAKSQNLSISNIWDITVYQLWDMFHRLNNNHILDIQAISVATWGDKEHRFDSSGWFKLLSN